MNIGIIGAGRFGTLLHKHLSTDNTVYVFDRDDSRVEMQDPTSLLECDMVIFAVPNRNLAEAVAEYKSYINQEATVIDVGSVKMKPCEILREAFIKNIIGTHPLFGPDSAGESWQDHKMVFCRLNISDERYDEVKQLFIRRGVKAFECTPQEHDQMMAKTQALVHFIGRALTGIQPQDISTPDYANLLKMMEKVTNDTWELFFDMQTLNPYAEVERQRLLQAMTNLEKRIDEAYTIES